LLNGEQSERRQNYPHSHAETAKQKAERACIGADPNAVFECVISYVEASEETANTEQDLTAQQRAAWGALIAAFAGIASVFVSFIGLYWIKGTLDATRDAANQATIATGAMIRQNRISEAAQRPWLEVEIVPKQIMEYNGVCIITLEVTVCNIGQTVAENVSLYGKFFNPNDLLVDITTGRFKGIKGSDYRKIYEFWRNTSDFRQYRSYVIIPRKKEKFICGVQNPEITDISHEIFVDERGFIKIEYAIHFEYTSNGGERSHNFQAAYSIYFKESEIRSRAIKRSDLPVFTDKFVVETTCYGLID